VLQRSKLAQRLPDELLDVGDRIRNSRERALGFSLAEAQGDQSLKGFRSRLGKSGTDRPAIGRAVGVREPQVRRGRPRDDELAVVNRAVVSRAEIDEAFEGVFAAFGPKDDVVHVREDRVPAAGNATFPPSRRTTARRRAGGTV